MLAMTFSTSAQCDEVSDNLNSCLEELELFKAVIEFKELLGNRDPLL
jgi:hypothetical protein